MAVLQKRSENCEDTLKSFILQAKSKISKLSLLCYRWIRLCSLQVITMISLTCQTMLCTSLGTVWVCISMFSPPTWSIPLWLWWVSSTPLEPSCLRLKCRPAGSHVSSKVRPHVCFMSACHCGSLATHTHKKVEWLSHCNGISAHIWKTYPVYHLPPVLILSGHMSVYLPQLSVFCPSGHKKLPSNQAMIKAVENDTKDIEKT